MRLDTRQVGKTHALKHFGQTSYENVAYLNFEKEEKLAQYFESTLDPKHLVNILSIHTNVEIEPHRTLLIFDEIQECPKALNSLKYFCEEANGYHVVAAGSLLGVKVAKKSSGARELPPHALTDPCVNLSIHRAPITQLDSLSLFVVSSRFTVVSQTRLSNITPSLHDHYSHFHTTTSDSASVFGISTLTLMGPPLEFLP